MGPCKTMTDTLAPVEHTNWALSAWNSTLDRNDVPSAWLYGQDHLWATSHLVSSLGHPGIRATQKLITDRYVWPNINADVRKWARACLSCQQSKVHRHTKSPPATFATPDARFNQVHIC